MIVAGSLFAAETALTTTIGWRDGQPSEPFGVVIPGTGQNEPVGRALLASGVSAPWPMPVLALACALAARPGRGWPARIMVALGATLAVGTLVEPVSYGSRSRTPHVLATVPLNLATAALPVLTGLRNRG